LQQYVPNTYKKCPINDLIHRLDLTDIKNKDNSSLQNNSFKVTVLYFFLHAISYLTV